jgi:hypothetical protein
VARIVVHEHPGLGDGPVEIEALAEEARVMEKAALRVAVVDLFFPGEPEPQRVCVEADAFDKLATDRAMAEVLHSARPARRPPRSTAASSARGDRTDYGTMANAGQPHKGRVTDAEKRLVREHFDEINDRLVAEGLPTVSLIDREHVERYGLDELARSRGIEPG